MAETQGRVTAANVVRRLRSRFFPVATTPSCWPILVGIPPVKGSKKQHQPCERSWSVLSN
eukprot:112910-Amphidinium_carterae.1